MPNMTKMYAFTYDKQKQRLDRVEKRISTRGRLLVRICALIESTGLSDSNRVRVVEYVSSQRDRGAGRSRKIRVFWAG